ncbi:hypothetical protein ACFPAF_04075 [Hymenobacter endophyticus]|uniref:DUF4239 domain-containing protein n=1 Tax=Hymenobacter endophyticus TaxID=3076335 RepID=A0ABU3TDU8_9BACT|nr:hypothetical protein [Hymenobacter endophyticus]MDU0369561.1 hypothetical protein [Hymenobacter endophyticus]
MNSDINSNGENNALVKIAILLGTSISIIMVLMVIAFFHNYEIAKNTGTLGDTIGGIAGPILNFVGLLVLYFSLREQYEARSEQRVQYDKDQARSENENALITSLKLIDDIKIEVDELSKNNSLKNNNTTSHVNITNGLNINFRNNLAGYSSNKKFRFRHFPLQEYINVELQGRSGALQNIVNTYFESIQLSFSRLTMLLEISTYLVQNSKLPSDIKAKLYGMMHILVEDTIEKNLGVSMLFRHENKAIEILINKLTVLDGLLAQETKSA